MVKKNMRIEKDSMGDVKVPVDPYYGAQTQRAIDNFTISELQFSKSFICSLAIIKRSAAIVNCRLKKINNKHSKAIIKACDEILDGKFDFLLFKENHVTVSYYYSWKCTINCC